MREICLAQENLARPRGPESQVEKHRTTAGQVLSSYFPKPPASVHRYVAPGPPLNKSQPLGSRLHSYPHKLSIIWGYFSHSVLSLTSLCLLASPSTVSISTRINLPSIRCARIPRYHTVLPFLTDLWKDHADIGFHCLSLIQPSGHYSLTFLFPIPLKLLSEATSNLSVPKSNTPDLP